MSSPQLPPARTRVKFAAELERGKAQTGQGDAGAGGAGVGGGLEASLMELVQNHQHSSLKLREQTERAKKDSIINAKRVSDLLMDAINGGVQESYVIEKRIELEIRTLAATIAKFMKQTDLWLATTNSINTAIKATVNGELAKEKVNSENGTKIAEEQSGEKVQEEKDNAGKEAGDEVAKEEIAVEVEPKTGVSFPVKLDDGKQLKCVGLRKKSMLGIGIKIYGFGIYADNEKLKDLLRSKIGKAPAKATKEMYQAVIDSDVGMTVRMVIVFYNLTMSMVRKNFDEGLGASIKKLTGGKKNDELANKVMGQASDDIKLTSGSVIEISRLPGYTLHANVMEKVVSNVESELLCRAFIHMYLGDDAFDKDAKEKFGVSLLSLF